MAKGVLSIIIESTRMPLEATIAKRPKAKAPRRPNFSVFIKYVIKAAAGKPTKLFKTLFSQKFPPKLPTA